MVSNASCTCTLLACIATIILLDDFFFFFLIVLRFLELPSLKFGGCIYSLYIAIPLYCKLFFFLSLLFKTTRLTRYEGE